MPIKLSEMGAKQKTATVSYLGETVNIVYRPAVITPRHEAQLSEQSGQKAIEGLVAQLVEIVVSWDVLGADGKPLKPTTELLMEMPSNFLLAVMDAIREDSAPNPRKR